MRQPTTNNNMNFNLVLSFFAELLNASKLNKCEYFKVTISLVIWQKEGKKTRNHKIDTQSLV